MKVKAVIGTKYKNKYYFTNQVFEIDDKDYKAMKDVVEKIEAEEKELSDLSLKELKDLAEVKHIEYPSNVRKNELIALLEGANDDEFGDA
jgi:hypothetical protein